MAKSKAKELSGIELIQSKLVSDKTKLVCDLSNIPIASYSKLDLYKQCPLRYYYKYEQDKRSNDTSLALELGSICHKVLELKGIELKNNKTITNDTYDYLKDILHNGYKDESENLIGVEQLKKKYFENWFGIFSIPSYTDKIKLFEDTTLKNSMSDDNWKVLECEMYFEFVYDNRIKIQGYIDRVDINDKGEYRVVDYKTSKKVYDNSKLTTSWQFGIYAMAILNKFGTLPKEYIYNFILLNETQYALTKGWEKRLVKQLDGILDKIDNDKKANEFIPNPTPLCHWCDFCKHNPLATTYRTQCEYHSLWQPDNKTFSVNKHYCKGVSRDNIINKIKENTNDDNTNNNNSTNNDIIKKIRKLNF